MAVILCALLGNSVSAAVQRSTEVGAVLCQTESPDLQIAQPTSDSVTNLPSVQIEGSALNTSQIDVFINSQYSHSVAIGFDSIIQTQASLQLGTNTITLQAYFSCNNTSAEVDIIIDYQPLSIPSNPNNIDTSATASAPGTFVRSQDGESSSLATQFVEFINEKLGIDEKVVDINSSVDRSFVRVTFSWIIFLALLLLMGLIFSPVSVKEKILIKLGFKSYSIRRNNRLIHLALIVLIILIAMVFSIS